MKKVSLAMLVTQPNHHAAIKICINYTKLLEKEKARLA